MKQPGNENIEIIYILDRSGSMESIKEGAIEGFNEFLEDQKDGDGEAMMSLVLFDDRIETPIKSLPVQRIMHLDERSYTTRGCTALLDAIGKTIKKTKKRIKQLEEADQPRAVIIAIFTDGLENASRKYNVDQISKMIRKRQKKDGWEFLFLAANQDAIATAAKISIPAHNSSNVAYSHGGMTSSLRATTRKIKAYRSSKLNREMSDEQMADLEKGLNQMVDEES
jgi:uncharacterized protein YegL